MKRIVYALLGIIIVFTAKTLPASAQSTESRPVSGFNKIISGEALTVHVKIDGTESLKIVGAPEVIRVVETTVKDGILTIKFKDNLKNGEGDTNAPLDIYVTAKSLSSIVKESSGSIDVDGIVSGGNVKLVLNGSGNIKAAVKAENLQVTITGAGNIILSGTADKAKVKIDGPGQMKGRGLKTSDASVMINGAGSAYLAADNTLSTNIDGAGGVVYSGNATVNRIGNQGSVSKAE